MLAVRLPNGWTVGVALAHIAFWDRQRLCLMRRWAAGDRCNGGYDGELFNEVLLPFLETIPSERAATLAVETTEEVDAFLLTLLDELVHSALACPDRPNLDRGSHRKDHLDQIDKALAGFNDEESFHQRRSLPAARKDSLMNANDFRELALGFDETEESAHGGAPDFRTGGRIFATLAHEHLGLGNLMLSPELQESLVAQAPEVFLPVSGGWGRQGITHIRLAVATPEQLLKGLHLAWNLRVQKNAKSRTKGRSATKPNSKGVAKVEDWREVTLARMRALILEADPEMTEERKWKKPTNPAGVPVWSHNGIICTGETYKKAVKLTFAKGASIPDPSGLFNSSLDGNTRRAIDIHEGEEVDADAFKALVAAAVAQNPTKRR